MKPNVSGPLLFVIITVVLLASCDVRLAGGIVIPPSGDIPLDTSPAAAPGPDRAALTGSVGIDLRPHGDGGE